ncbi:MAG: hypothetical protein WKF31_03525 [Thermoleophilaceae bacterium]
MHSAFMWQQGGRAFVVMVDDEEAADVDIMEITDPRRPRLVSETDLNALGVEQPRVNGEQSFLHDMTVKRIRGVQTMLASYWDGGYVAARRERPGAPTADLEHRLRGAGPPARRARTARPHARGQRPPGGVRPPQPVLPGHRRGLPAHPDHLAGDLGARARPAVRGRAGRDGRGPRHERRQGGDRPRRRLADRREHERDRAQRVRRPRVRGGGHPAVAGDRRLRRGGGARGM